jgi:hypothetical protein
VHFPDDGGVSRLPPPRVARSLGLTVPKVNEVEFEPRHTSDESNGYGSEDFEELDEELDETSPSDAAARAHGHMPSARAAAPIASSSNTRGVASAPEASRSSTAAAATTSPLSAADDSYGSQSFAQPSRSVASTGTEGYSEVCAREVHLAEKRIAHPPSRH